MILGGIQRELGLFRALAELHEGGESSYAKENIHVDHVDETV